MSTKTISFHVRFGSLKQGEPLRDVTYPVHTISQATALCWHPERRQLVAGWENGELNTWSAGQRTFSSIQSTHKSPIVFVGFSEQGGRMVTADSVSILKQKLHSGFYFEFMIIFLFLR